LSGREGSQGREGFNSAEPKTGFLKIISKIPGFKRFKKIEKIPSRTDPTVPRSSSRPVGA